MNTQNFDVIFVDGLHTYEQVHRDVQNSLRCLNKDGYIVMHDLLPRNWIEQHRPQLTPSGPYLSDGWKTAFDLLKVTGIDFKLVKIDHGVGVIRKKDSSATLKNSFSELLDKQFSYFVDNIEKLPVIEWNEFLDWSKQ